MCIYIYIIHICYQEASIKCWWLVSSSFFICQYQGSTNNNDGFWVMTNTTNWHRYETTPLIRSFPSRSSGILLVFFAYSISIHFYISLPHGISRHFCCFEPIVCLLLKKLQRPIMAWMKDPLSKSTTCKSQLSGTFHHLAQKVWTYINVKIKS